VTSYLFVFSVSNCEAAASSLWWEGGLVATEMLGAWEIMKLTGQNWYRTDYQNCGHNRLDQHLKILVNKMKSGQFPWT
jgi:hypothetical protein